ncbi:hypothetical protein ANO14919_092770 [Xylariales sp. No.14919]|nr:hypothetical protein ANO14919_092770 [Xylariales sp. No.14919]
MVDELKDVSAVFLANRSAMMTSGFKSSLLHIKPHRGD